MAGKIFINYRRGDDPGHTGRLFDRLQDVFERERLFLDIDDIAPGVDFIRVLDERLAECDVVLAVIGKGWIDARDATGARRLDDPHDFVRIEIAAALSRGKRVIPVLVGEAQMPRRDELPELLRPLARRNAVRLTHEQFHADMQGLVKAIQQAFEEVKALRQTQAVAVRRAQAEEGRKREEHAAVERAKAHRAGMETDDPAVLRAFLDSYPKGSDADQVRWRLRRYYIHYFIIKKLSIPFSKRRAAINLHFLDAARIRRILVRLKRTTPFKRSISTVLRPILIGASAVSVALVIGMLALWFRLSSAPIDLSVFTPWLVAAIQQTFGTDHVVQIGGTQIERTEKGGAAVLVRDIVVRDPDGTVVASAPKAEIRVAGMSLLSGHMRAESLNLVGAGLAVRIGRDDDVFATLLSWIDGIGESGLDGHDLRELGLKDGTLTVDDARTGKRWKFEDISLSLERPHGGGIVLTVGSDNPQHPWGLTASIKPTRDGYRSIALEARQVSAGDLLLASRLGDGSLQINMPVSASLRGEIGPNGVPQSLTGRIVADAGSIGDADAADGRVDIDRAEFKINWDAATGLLSVPFQILSGGNRITLLGEVQAPPQTPGPWLFQIGGGTVLLNSPGIQGDPLILNRIAVTGMFDPVKKRFVVDHGDVGNADVGVALSGNADYSSGDLRLTAGLAATRMSADAMKRLWPIFIIPKVRDWFSEHLLSGTVERVVIAVNAPLDTLRAGGPPVPDDGLTINAVGTNCVIRPVAGLPALHDADLAVHIVGRDAQITLGKATADLPSGRKLVMSSGLFEVPDFEETESSAKISIHVSGPTSGVIELLATDRIRNISGPLSINPETVRGTTIAQAFFALPLNCREISKRFKYEASAQILNLVIDQFRGRKIEADELQIDVTTNNYRITGLARISSAPTNLRIAGELPLAGQSN